MSCIEGTCAAARYCFSLVGSCRVDLVLCARKYYCPLLRNLELVIFLSSSAHKYFSPARFVSCEYCCLYSLQFFRPAIPNPHPPPSCHHLHVHDSAALSRQSLVLHVLSAGLTVIY
jgi:hypothetical protein